MKNLVVGGQSSKNSKILCLENFVLYSSGKKSHTSELTDNSLLLLSRAGRDGDLGNGVLEHFLTHFLSTHELSRFHPAIQNIL